MRFEGQTAIVTGAARGIGAAIAQRLASEGASVMIADIDQQAATETAAAVPYPPLTLPTNTSV